MWFGVVHCPSAYATPILPIICKFVAKFPITHTQTRFSNSR